jgi:hypothetical protein
MRRLIAATVLILVLSPKAWAQGYARPPAAPPPIPGQTATPASYDTAALLAVYMSQLASSGRAPNQSDIDEATRQYFTNGAAASTVPTSGPGAAYFQNGAGVMSYGASPSPTPTAVSPTATAPAPSAPAPAPPVVAPPVTVYAPSDTTTAAPSPDDTSPPASTTPGVTEAQAASPMSQAAAASPAPVAAQPPAPAAPPIYQTILVSTPQAPAPEPDSAVQCPPAPSALGRVASAFGGLLFGGFAVALWLRPRMIRGGAPGGGVTP